MLLQYDREELYEKVWARPLIKVAHEYGVSTVALGKTCRKLQLPVPGRGYWAKKAHGHPVECKILPTAFVSSRLCNGYSVVHLVEMGVDDQAAGGR